ncbi:triose-phosphate isomerase [Pseudomonas sp. LRF_L74]|uniref:triose-phosphate isomerase n=1 Tax=Pseudomonas sp. LRF_L74 TaxID=3369422 RepID=UPI003F646B08
MRRPLVAGNWKMHGTRASVAELVAGLAGLELPESVEAAVIPSFLFTEYVVANLGKRFVVGAQDCAIQSAQGALTGEVASTQLSDVGCSLVLIGHSERRSIIGESDEILAQKFSAALDAGLVPVLCVGESLAQREAGKTLSVIDEQLGSMIAQVGIEAFARAVIAYEPVWAIGTGLTASPQQAQDVHAAIRSRLAGESAEIAQGIRILYGGSVKAANAAELFGMPDIDGGLVGGASLNADEFGAICRAAGS